MIHTATIMLLLGGHHPAYTEQLIGRVVKPLGDIPKIRDYKSREPITLEPEPDSDQPLTRAEAIRRRKREYYLANRERILDQQKEQKAVKRRILKQRK